MLVTNEIRNTMAKINRRLAHRNEKLHKTRDRWVNDLGQFHILDERTNFYCGPRFNTVEDLDRYLDELDRVQGDLEAAEDKLMLSPHGLMEYVFEMPTVVPTGKLLVHNTVRPTRNVGMRGFRAWFQGQTDRLEVCDCSWAAELGDHYRIRRDLLRKESV